MLLALYITLVCYIPIVGSLVPSTSFGAGMPDIGPERLLSYALLLAFIIHWSVTRHIKKFHKWLVILGTFYIIAVASVSWSNYSYDRSTLQEIFSTIFMPFFLAVVSYNIFGEEHNAELYMKHIIVSSFILSIMSICQMIIGLLAGHAALRSSGVLNNSNLLAIFLVLSLPCVMHAREKQIIPKSLLRIVTICIVGGIVCTVSRKGTITMALCFCIYVFLKKKYKAAIFVIVGMSLLAVVLSGFAIISHRFQQDVMVSDLEGKWRMTLAGWNMFKSKPIFGLGFEGYYENFHKYFPNLAKRKYDAHNIFITALANYGIVGFIPFVSIFLYPLIVSMKILRQQDRLVSNDHLRDMSVLCISSLVPFMISGWFAGGLFYTPVVMFLLYTNITLFLSSNDSAKHANLHDSSSATRKYLN